MIMKKTTLYLLTVVGILILVNILSDSFFLRLDLTSDQRYTLSRATKNILKTLDEPVTVTAYFSKKVPNELKKTHRDFKELLVEYQNISKGHLVYEFIDPSSSEELEQKATSAGIQPRIVGVRDKDQMTQQKVYIGAVVSMGDEAESIPFMPPGSAMEYALSTAIKKLAVKDKARVGFIQGHGEPTLEALPQSLAMLEIQYQSEPVYLEDTVNQLLQYNTVVLLAPTDSIPEEHFRQLDEYLANGGNLYVGINRVMGNLNVARGLSLTTGLESWLLSKGLVVEDNFVIDNRCGSIQVRQQQGMFTYSTNIQFPYIPVIQTFADHPITTGLEGVLLPFASTVYYSGDTTRTFTPLLSTSDLSGTMPSPVYFDASKQWSPNDFPMKNLTVGGILSGKITGERDARIVLIGDGDFSVNGSGEQMRQQTPDNISLFVNAIDYLSDDTGMIELRTKGVSNRPLDQLEDGKKAFLKYLNFLLPILLVVIYGLFRMQYNRNLRNKRMEEGYV
jgi:gliding-associated putative ABC transporter substrate-binding component GldG